MEIVFYILLIIVAIAGSFFGAYAGAMMKSSGVSLPSVKLPFKKDGKEVMEEINRINKEFEDYLYDNEEVGEDIG